MHIEIKTHCGNSYKSRDLTAEEMEILDPSILADGSGARIPLSEKTVLFLPEIALKSAVFVFHYD